MQTEWLSFEYEFPSDDDAQTAWHSLEDAIANAESAAAIHEHEYEINDARFRVSVLVDLLTWTIDDLEADLSGQLARWASVAHGVAA
jgi:hypothetical protein